MENSVRFLLIISLLFVASCSNTLTTNAHTTFDYMLALEVDEKKLLKKVVIATVNYSKRSPSYLRNRGYKADKLVVEYLKKNGFEVLAGNQFDTVWSRGLEVYGDYDDPYSAKFRRDRFESILADSLKVLKQEHGVDAVIFTDLMPKTVTFTSSTPHVTAWDGVKRRLQVRGDKRIPRSFNWAHPFHAVSLSITIFHADNRLLFSSVGGIEVIDNLDMRSGSPKVKRNRSILSDQDLLMEGAALAFHPFIAMHDYPASR